MKKDRKLSIKKVTLLNLDQLGFAGGATNTDIHTVCHPITDCTGCGGPTFNCTLNPLTCT